MFSFNAFCQFMTNGMKYSWFYCRRTLLNCVDKVNLDLIHIEPINGEDNLIRVWYPKSKWEAQLTKEQLVQQLQQALIDNDLDKVKQLKERINSYDSRRQ